jgi:lipid-A-disaccharide synthase
LAAAEAAVVCSGTASLETAFFNVPQICAYKANAASLKIAKLFVKVKYMSLVNLCMNKEIVPELLQEKFNVSTIKSHLDQILIGGTSRNKMLEEYAQLQSLFGEIAPTNQAAAAILKLIKA